MTIHEINSPNFNERPQGITPNLIVIHYTDMLGVDAEIERMLIQPSSSSKTWRSRTA